MKNENQIQDKIYQSFQDNFKKDSADLEILLGLSGGLDSSVLLHLLANMQTQLDFKLKAIHVHHGISPYANDWLNFCKDVRRTVAMVSRRNFHSRGNRSV